MLHKYLEHFKAVAEAPSMLKASEQLCISQPSISRSIKILEDIIGTKLFTRNNKGVETTEYGDILYRQVCIMNKEFIYALEEIKHINDHEKYKLYIGSGLVGQYNLIPYIISNYSDKLPNVQINTITGYSKYIYDLLQRGFLDIIFCDISSIRRTEGICSESFVNVHFSLFACINHPIFQNEDSINNLDKYNFAVFSHSNTILSNNINDENMITEREQDRIKYISSSIINLMEVVGNSMYITILPSYMNHITEKFNLKEIDPTLRRSSFASGIVYHRSSLDKPHVAEFVQSARNLIANHGLPRIKSNGSSEL